jgi:hypothetical protein
MYVNGDSARLIQAFANITCIMLQNYTAGRRLYISIACSARKHSGARISVHGQHGQGIAPELPAARVSTTLTQADQFAGTFRRGLGVG